jgi:hypothetical protein
VLPPKLAPRAFAVNGARMRPDLCTGGMKGARV